MSFFLLFFLVNHKKAYFLNFLHLFHPARIKNSWKRHYGDVLLLSGFCFFGTLLDQVTKLWARTVISPAHPKVVTWFLSWVHAWNPGVSFGLFPCSQKSCHRLIAFILIFCVFLMVVFFQSKNRIQKLGIGLLLSGAMGNLFDRVHFSAVFDFILVHWGSWAFPAFNVADMLVSMGFLTLMYSNFQWRALFIPVKNH